MSGPSGPARTSPGGLRLAIAMFTVAPVPRSWHGEVAAGQARATLVWLPFVGAGLGALAGLPAAAVLARAPGAGFVAAVVGVAVLVALTRGLHLDGLADTADGLGSRAPAERALAIMRRSDVGPFGVFALLAVVLVDVAALSAMVAGRTWYVLAVLALAAATGRLAVVHAAMPGIAAARGSGFGSLVAGGVSRPTAGALTAAVLGGGVLVARWAGASPIGWPLAQVVALALTAGFRVHATRRLGGVTGDVFGALVEICTALTLLGLLLTIR
jgi:adenosylcobinamide-GDP ribazoletransferase